MRASLLCRYGARRMTLGSSATVAGTGGCHVAGAMRVVEGNQAALDSRSTMASAARSAATSARSSAAPTVRRPVRLLLGTASSRRFGGASLSGTARSIRSNTADSLTNGASSVLRDGRQLAQLGATVVVITQWLLPFGRSYLKPACSNSPRVPL